MREDDSAVTQDDSASLYAYTLFRYLDETGDDVESIDIDDIGKFSVEGDLQFEITSPSTLDQVVEFVKNDKITRDDAYGVAEKFYSDEVFVGKEDSIDLGTYDSGLTDRLRVDTVEKSWSVGVYRVVAGGESSHEYNQSLLGVAVDMPESGVYIDWYREAFPDPLDHSYVSEYGSLDDVRNATGNRLVLVEELDLDEIQEDLEEGGNVVENDDDDSTGFVETNEKVLGSGVESFDGSDVLDTFVEKFVGGSYHRRRKLLERGAQVSSDCLENISRAHKSQVWPKSIEKSPSWTGSSDVDKETQEWVNVVLDMKDPMWDEYSNTPMAAALTVKDEISTSLTQSQGWSIDSIQRRLRDDFPQLEKYERVRIARQEVAGVLNFSKIIAIQARKGDPLVRWVGPGDTDSTTLCKQLERETSGGVPLSEMLELLKEYAEEFGGTPERSQQGLPHIGCRYTIELVDQ